ncbi:ABC transporter permease [Paenibacillus sp. YN15]|uniref:ABC transporter permease n=1 Tax=Paenibacillus sp. YN15 TaxID=1742774 RepID=UPI000DCE54F2|nr:FtsX-like permease family protein [Paenibacillus sp. YN15]RAU97937.1 bacitracin ABC transporter permease [Paenibacillus sp. YN15]
MNIHFIILRNLKKNLRNYYLYVFALIFSVALYFSFVTLRYDPALGEMEGTVKGGAAIGASSVLLVVIVAVFLLYANTIFIKRRSREIGLFQLIGLTKGKIFRLFSAENLILYFGSMLLGIGGGFGISRLMLMILFKIIEVEEMARLRFSPEALKQTILVFASIYLLIMLMNYLFIKSQTILSLFRVLSTAQERVKRISIWDIIMGVLGLGFIGGGYALSARLFGGAFTSMTELMAAMVAILASVIAGTYLFYKGSVRFLFNLARKSQNGYLSVKQVLSLSSIMFRMRSNALLLTVITTVSALAIGLLSLSYISYTSAAILARESSPHDFGFVSQEDKGHFTAALDKAGIGYREIAIPSIKLRMDPTRLLDPSLFTGSEDSTMEVTVVGDRQLEHIDIRPGEARFISSSALENFLSPRNNSEVTIFAGETSYPVTVTSISKEALLPIYYGQPLIIDQADYQNLSAAASSQEKANERVYYGILLAEPGQIKAANAIFNTEPAKQSAFSQYENLVSQRTNMGLIMFIVAFLGLTFLITSGCILYFKQMDESEEEKGGYTILRKLGFTPGDLLSGIRFKQLFNFGIPLVVGLSHSYFAVKSGWFFFGTEMLSPTILVMLVYTGLYSIFGILSVLYCKRVIGQSL